MSEISIPSDPVINVLLIPHVGTDGLQVGDRFKVDVWLQALAPAWGVVGHILHVRGLQFDTCMSKDVKVREFWWDMRRLENEELYHKDRTVPFVQRANYGGLEPYPGKILYLNDSPAMVGSYRIKITGDKPVFSVVGEQLPEPLRDKGLRFDGDFGKNTKRYRPADGNVRGGRIELAVSTDVD